MLAYSSGIPARITVENTVRLRRPGNAGRARETGMNRCFRVRP